MQFMKRRGMKRCGWMAGLVILSACAADTDAPGVDPVVGTWDVRLLEENDDDAIPCTVTVAAAGAFGVECVIERRSEPAYCDPERSVLRVKGRVDGGRLDLTVHDDDTYVGDACAGEDIEVGRLYSATEGAVEAARTAGGPGLVGGAWDVTLFDYDCDVEDMLAPCDDAAGRSRDPEPPATCEFAFDGTDVTLLCRGTDDDDAVCIRGALSDGTIALVVEELPRGGACGDGPVQSDIRIEGTRR